MLNRTDAKDTGAWWWSLACWCHLLPESDRVVDIGFLQRAH